MIFAAATANAAVHYVTQGGAGNKDGSSWANAYDEAAFPAAIASADAGDEIRVKAGVYRPSTTNVATASFVLKNGVALYGGFAGTETSSADRDPAANLTVLTGDLANDDTGKVNGVTVSADQIQGTNSDCVVTTSPGCGAATVLDGFTVTAGDNATGNGGGMYIEGGSPTATNCAFSGNYASNGGGVATTSGGNAVIANCVFSGNSGGEGGGMYNVKNSTPTVTNCAFTGNFASFSGGGMANYDKSNAVVTDCAFSGNTVQNSLGGGMYNNDSSPTVTNCTFSGNSGLGATSYGSGMYNDDGSSPTVTNSTFSGNSSKQRGGGMYNREYSSPTVTNCAFSGNSAATDGGGMGNFNGSSPAVTNCTFSGNSAAQFGGGMYNLLAGNPVVTNCVFSANSAATDGGGMYNRESEPEVTNCTFSGNSAAQGGGMYNYFHSDPTVTGCAFSGNSAASYGGGMYNNGSDPTVTNCAFSGNNASDGGGMCNVNGNPAVTNCTFSENSAPSGGGGMYNGANSSPKVTNCTFSGNSASSSSGGGMCNYYNTAVTVVTNSIFWGDTGGEIRTGGPTDPTVTYSVVQGGYSGAGNLNIDPLLGPLADNGGPTNTHALTFGSPAIDAGEMLLPSVVSTDQRGVARPYPSGGSFDIGAYEYGREILTVGITGSGSVTRDPSGDVVGATGKCWSYDNGTTVTLTAVEGVRSWFVTWSGDASGTNPTATVTMSAPRTVEASFDVAWIVTVSADPGGDVTAAPGAGSSGASAPRDRGDSGTPTVKVRNGADKTFTVTPNAGYSIGSVRVDGDIVLLGAGSTYTFANVSQDHAIEATFTASPTPTTAPVPTTGPTTAPTVTPTATPTPVPTPDPDIPLPKVTLKITLYAGGTVVAGPIDITDPATLAALLSSPTLLAQLLATDPAAILSGNYNMDLMRFFSLVADLDDGVLDFTILFEATVDNVPAGYWAQLFVLTRTFDSNGNPTGYAIVPRSEGTSVFRKGNGARGWTEAWRVTVRDGGSTDGDGKQNGSVTPQIAAVVAVFPLATPTVTMTPTQGSTGSGGGCSLPAIPSAALATLLLLAPLLFVRRR
jgi:parallel beta-helix repeat protein